jgi:bla regulator protein BlaR1
MNFIQSMFSSSVSEALGWTILHSLWQGAIVALLLYIAQVLTRRHSASLRYNLSLGAMLVMCAAVIITYFYSYHPAANDLPVSQGGPGDELAPTVFVIHNTVAGSFNMATVFGASLPWIVSAWLAGVLLFSIRFAGSMLYLNRLRGRSSRGMNDLQQQVIGLCQRLKVSRPVKLAESALVKVPVTLGYLKPVILLPAGLASGLAPAELEAVLAHELAHIRRNDFIINMIQSFMEIFFFYHPAVHWINSVARKERENCCDDVAITISGALPLARALARLEELHAGYPALALAATGQGALLYRIKRLFAPHSSNALPKWPGTALIMAGVLLVGITMYSNAKADNRNDSLLTPPAKDTLSVALPCEGHAMSYLPGDDTLKKNKNKNGKEVIIVKDKEGKTTSMYIDGQKIAAEKLAEEESKVSKEDVVELSEKESEQMMSEMEKHSQAMDDLGKQMNEIGIRMNEIGMRMNNIKFPQPPPVPDTRDYEKAMAKYEEKMKAYEKEMEKYEEMIKPYEKAMEEYEQQMKPYEKEMKKYEEKMQEHEKVMKVYENRSKQFEKALEAELLADKLIKSTKKYMFKVDSESLYINEVKQPQELYEKYSTLLKITTGQNVKKMERNSSYMIIKN